MITQVYINTFAVALFLETCRKGHNHGLTSLYFMRNLVKVKLYYVYYFKYF